MDADRIRAAWPKLEPSLKDSLVALAAGYKRISCGLPWFWESPTGSRFYPNELPKFSTWEGFGALVAELERADIGWEIAAGARDGGAAWASIQGKMARRGTSPADALAFAFVLSRAAERIPEEFPLGVEP
jgi:hypothetical protein